MAIGSVELLIITALCIAVLFIFTVLLARRVANGIRNAASEEIHKLGLGGRTALEILDERYARGEIGREEYQRMRRDIEGA